jgi:hypothetical protein
MQVKQLELHNIIVSFKALYSITATSVGQIHAYSCTVHFNFHFLLDRTICADTYAIISKIPCRDRFLFRFRDVVQLDQA